MRRPSVSPGIVLTEGHFSISYRGHTGQFLCSVTFDLTRKHHVLIDCQESLHQLHPDLKLLFNASEPFVIEGLPGMEPMKCHIFGETTQQIIGDDPSLYVTLMPIGAASVIRADREIVRVNAGIVSFNHYWMNGPAKSRFSLTDDTWAFEFTPVDEEIFEFPTDIQNDSCSFTHHVLLRKNSGELFTIAEARSALFTLSTFLSFCAEHWVGVALVEGVDESGIVTMQEWGTPLLDPKQNPHNWLDEHHGSAMLAAFPKFSRLMNDPLWRKTVRTAVYWYVRADSAHVGTDGATILVQAALERLAWHVLVQEQRTISASVFSKLPAADRLRLLLKSSSIPLELPTELAELTAEAKSRSWIDGPHAFVAIRNQIVHPRKRLTLKGHIYFEALQLGKWYLELVLLRACNFSGEYARRVKISRWSGDVELVPWA